MTKEIQAPAEGDDLATAAAALVSAVQRDWPGASSHRATVLAAADKVQQVLTTNVQPKGMALPPERIDALIAEHYGEHVVGRDLIHKVVCAAVTAVQAPAPAPENRPACNPHPKAPHGFDRNASHNAGRYVCDCEGWDAWDAGYQEGVRASLDTDESQAPAVAHRPLTEDDKRALVVGWFAEDWAIENAMGLLGDYDTLLSKPPVQGSGSIRESAEWKANFDLLSKPSSC